MYPIFDGHNDLFEDVHEKRARGLDRVIERFHVPQWKKGGCVGGFYPIWVDPEQTVYPEPPAQQAPKILRHMVQELAQAENGAVAATTLDQFHQAVDSGRHALILGAEGLSFLGSDLGQLKELYALGLREASLTWNEENALAAGANADLDHGLTDAGRECVRELQRLHMILDLAHTNEKTFWEALSLIEGPFMVSHGSVRSLCGKSRNLTDDQLRAVGEAGGVVGVCPYGPFLAADPREWTLEHYCRHIEHAVEVAGIDHVGLGFDFTDYLDDFGIDESVSHVTAGIGGVAQAQNVPQALSSHGFSPREIEKICCGNFLRLVGDVLR